MDNQTRFLQQHSNRYSRVHRQFLQSRQSALRELRRLLKAQAALAAPDLVSKTDKGTPLFSRLDLEEFALGSLAHCFGPEFAVFEGRRVPRIPNGDLLLFDRVLEIQGERHALQAPASIVSACDVPLDAWYLRSSEGSFVPLSVLMEMALQPCGFLSAYLGTALSSPDQDFLFRNLDGEATLLKDLDLRGQTVINQASLLSTVSGAGTIVQTFSFCLTCNGSEFFRGQSVFGYFPETAMARQAGLDQQYVPHKPPAMTVNDRKSPASSPHAQLDLLDEIQIATSGGNDGMGMAYGRKRIDPQDWFFACHFYQDPVMPGSLGVESVLQSLRQYTLAAGLTDGFAAPRFAVLDGMPMQWKYRGQITPAHQEMELEVQIKHVQALPGETRVLADASVWADGKRIYEIVDIGMKVQEG